MCDDKEIINETREGETELKKTDFLKANLTDGNISKLLSRIKDETTKKAIKTLKELDSKIIEHLELKKNLKDRSEKINNDRESLKKKLLDGHSRYERALVENIEGILTDEALKNIKAENTDFENAIQRCEDIDRTIKKLLQKNAEGEKRIPAIKSMARLHFFKAAFRELSAKIDEPIRELLRDLWSIRRHMGAEANYERMINELFPREPLEQKQKRWDNFVEKYGIEH